VLDAGTGKSIGTIAAMSGDVGLAHLRLGPALAAAEDRQALEVAGSSARVVPHRPSWWLPSWGREEGQSAPVATDGSL
jgi:hypothetical protein